MNDRDRVGILAAMALTAATVGILGGAPLPHAHSHDRQPASTALRDRECAAAEGASHATFQGAVRPTAAGHWQQVVVVGCR